MYLSTEEFRSQNEYVCGRFAPSGGRAIGFVYFNPQHAQASLDELNRFVRDDPC